MLLLKLGAAAVTPGYQTILLEDGGSVSGQQHCDGGVGYWRAGGPSDTVYFAAMPAEVEISQILSDW